MGRNRVLSFMSQFSAGTKTPPHSSSPPNDSSFSHRKTNSVAEPFPDLNVDLSRAITPPEYGTPLNGSPTNTPPRQRSSSRPLSMVLAHNPPLMDITEDTIPELQPIFTYLNSHSNKLYQEGYFLKLDDQNTQGRPNADRTWTECFAQLVGTVLSLWDAAELDAAGEDGEVLPKFINLTDASIKMIESLPTRSSDEQPLQNILSLSTAGRNRYLLHFNSRHSLLQWTAAIRLAMFEHSTLQEAYTGALIAGKGKTLNNINIVMERSRFKTEEWVRVRFGAGVPWRRCWCVITPPDEKEYAKLQKEMKKRSPYDRSSVPLLKGDIKFYDSRKDGKKQKKALPIASITDAYSAYAIYPQSKSLIDASTLLKIEGNIAIHTDPPSSTEGFVFIMPETHPAVSGFEMLLRFLFPTWDTFGLYGRPGRLVASVLDPRSLMFAMPKHKRYGYLENLDVSNLILEDSGAAWNEREWRKRLKEATGQRMNTVEDVPSSRSRSNSRKSVRLSFGAGSGGTGRPKVGFSDERGSVRSSRSHSLNGPARTDSGPSDPQRERLMAGESRARNVSDPHGGVIPRNNFSRNGSPYSGTPQRNHTPIEEYQNQPAPPYDGPNFDDEHSSNSSPPLRDLDGMRQMHTPEPVSRPPALNHAPQARPTSNIYHSPELRHANSRLSSTTLAQLAKAGGIAGPVDSNSPAGGAGDAGSGPSVLPHANNILGISANDNRSREALTPPGQTHAHNVAHNAAPPSLTISTQQRSRSPLAQSPYGPPSPFSNNPHSRPSTAGDGSRSPMAPVAPGPLGPPGSMGPPGMMGPPRSRPQTPNYRAELAGGPRPDGRPADSRPPPGHGPHGQMQDRRPSDPRTRGPPPHGAHPQQRMPDRKPSNPQFRPGQGPPPQGPPGNGFRPNAPGSQRPMPPVELPGAPGNGFRPSTPGSQRSQGPVELPGAPGGGFRPSTPGSQEHAVPVELPGVSGPNTSQMSYRKPLPDRSAVFNSQKASIISGSSIVTANDIIDHYAYDQGPPRSLQGTPNSERRPFAQRQQSEMSAHDSSQYDDASSVDYASTHKSSETGKSIERPRAGVLKTTGGDEPDAPSKDFDIPEINFGPTINYGASPPARSKTPNGLQQARLSGSPQLSSPGEKGPSPPLHKTTGQQSPHERTGSDDSRRQVPWQPGAPAPASSPKGLNAEDYVKQKAAHARSSSSNTLGGMRSETPTSHKRRSSYDMLKRHSRGSSADLLSRPGSRGAAPLLSYSSGEVSNHLSAREQEQVARMTGGPLISMAANPSKRDSQGPGLVGAIEVREREREQMKQGATSQAVQQAINQRQHTQAMAYQQQMAQQQMAQQRAAQQQMAQQQMMQQQQMQQQQMQHGMSQHQIAQQQMAQQQQVMAQHAYQQQMMERSMSPPGYSTMGRGGGPGPYGPGPMQYGAPQQMGYSPQQSFSRPLQSPPPGGFVPPPQGQYGPGGGVPQQRGVHPQYQGQAF